jgi:hypothetical protein
VLAIMIIILAVLALVVVKSVLTAFMLFPLAGRWNPSLVPAPNVSLLDALFFLGAGYYGARRTGRVATGVVVSPKGEQVTLGAGGAQSVALDEQGFYSVRLQGSGDRRPFEVAVNLEPSEADLTAVSPQDFLAGTAGRAAVEWGQH